MAESAIKAAAHGDPLMSEPRSFTSSSKAVESWANSGYRARISPAPPWPEAAIGGMGAPSSMLATACAMRGDVALQEIGQPRKHDAAHDAIGQIISERDRGGKRLDAGVAVALFEREALAGRLAHRRGDAVHHHRGIALDHFQKHGAAGGDPLHGGVGDAHRFALPSDSKSGVEIDVPPIVENDGQEFTKRLRAKTYLAT